jgi:poly-gamma-glutamate capsule biosynthesis protein CapA/YwtB (metallophosphatase superfamily)
MNPVGKYLPAALGRMVCLSGCRNPNNLALTLHSSTENLTFVTETGSTQGIPSPSVPGSIEPILPPTEENTPSETKPLPTEETPVDLAFVGDIMLGRSLAQRIADGKGDAIFNSVNTVLQSADIAVGNLECAIGEGGTKAKKGYAFLAPTLSASILGHAGFDLLSLANNHSFDYGPEVFRQTQQLLTDNGMKIVGAGVDDSQAYSAIVYDIHGMRLAFLSYADVPVERGGFDAKTWTAGESTPGIAWADNERIISNLQVWRSRADFLVVLFHFGIEGSVTPSDRQVELAHLAVDNGADLVVGSHPHLMQKDETYKGRLIFYSMGDFVFDGFIGSYNHSAILQVTVSRKNPVKYLLIPVFLVDGIPFLGQQ